MQIKIIIGLIICLLIAASVIFWMESKITKLEGEATLYELSNQSLVKQNENAFKYIEGTQTDLQTCMDSKGVLIQKFNKASKLIHKASPTAINSKEVVDNETLKTIIDTLNRPLPNGSRDNDDRVRQHK